MNESNDLAGQVNSEDISHINDELWIDNHDDDDDDDDDEDNWSKQVETDDILQRVSSSITGGETHTIDDDEDVRTRTASGSDDHRQRHHQQPPRRQEPTIKEKLIERERQQRVESERARWKRQFALAAHAERDYDEDDDADNNPPDAIGDRLFMNDLNGMNSMARESANSVAGTVGEDTVAPIETLEDDNDDTNMNYPMERFLKEHHQTTMEDEGNTSVGKETNQGVVMERFLQEPPTVTGGGRGEGSSTSSPMAPRTTSTGTPPVDHQNTGDNIPLDLTSNNTTGNDDSYLMLDFPIEPVDHIDTQSSSQPRVVLRLTEAEIQEMAAIDEASRSNAPPSERSERDDMSELGELVSDFGGLTHVYNQSMSQGTPVTVIESASSSVGNQVGLTVLSTSSSGHGIDAIEGYSISSNIVPSSGGCDASLTGNPPSDIVRYDDDDEDDNDRVILSPHSQIPTDILPTITSVDASLPQFTTVVGAGTSGDSENEVKMEVDENVVNRTMRPGMFNYKQSKPHNGMGNIPDTTSRTIKKTSSFPDQIVNNDDGDNHIEGFDFDKNNQFSPHSPSIVHDQKGIVACNELWSSGFSPDHERTEHNTDSSPLPAFPNYGITDLETQRLSTGRRIDTINPTSSNDPCAKVRKNGKDGEQRPLLEGIDIAVINHRRRSSWNSLSSARNMDDLNSLCDSVFSDIRSQSTATRNIISNDADVYLQSSVLKRAFPERTFALIVTLIFELPTLFFISGGSDQLCSLIGRVKFTSLISLLPITSAISGNVGLQASTLTTRAISHGQVRKENYTSWLCKEIGTALYIGVVMGVVAGTMAFFMGGLNIAFGFTIFVAQFIGIITAGCTGTLAPLLFTFIFERDSGKWGGPLETAVQDVVGSFAMIVISYRIMLAFGPYDIEPSDMCGIVN
mmetsp:Transcript_33422/g.37300  ORF Transcript_33422/g.37300 Transcript_33422/m.37300 type:complete len:911 (-) Transcript_33422:22-2754(-)